LKRGISIFWTLYYGRRAADLIPSTDALNAMMGRQSETIHYLNFIHQLTHFYIK